MCMKYLVCSSGFFPSLVYIPMKNVYVNFTQWLVWNTSKKEHVKLCLIRGEQQELQQNISDRRWSPEVGGFPLYEQSYVSGSQDSSSSSDPYNLLLPPFLPLLPDHACSWPLCCPQEIITLCKTLHQSLPSPELHLLPIRSGPDFWTRSSSLSRSLNLNPIKSKLYSQSLYIEHIMWLWMLVIWSFVDRCKVFSECFRQAHCS